jgi:hypothetical protein
MQNNIQMFCPCCGESVERGEITCKHCHGPIKYLINKKGIKIENNNIPRPPKVPPQPPKPPQKSIIETNNIKKLETMGAIIAVIYSIAGGISIIVGFFDATYAIPIGIGLFFTGMLYYSINLVFCGMARSLLEIKDDLKQTLENKNYR